MRKQTLRRYRNRRQRLANDQTMNQYRSPCVDGTCRLADTHRLDIAVCRSEDGRAAERSAVVIHFRRYPLKTGEFNI